MKTLIFITLKILEVLLIPASYLGLCSITLLLFKIPSLRDSIDVEALTPFYSWSNAFIGMAVVVTLIVLYFIVQLIIVLFPLWIKSNKKLTSKIYKRLKK